MERWLVTGANGFLGSRLMKFYQEKYEITGAHHGNLDITDEAAAAEFVRAAAPQLVIHCAAISNTGTCQENPGLSEAVNVNGAVNLARACRETGSRLIFMSSIRFTQETGPWYRRRRRILRSWSMSTGFTNGRQRRRLWPYFRTQCASDCRGCMISPGGG